MQFQGKLMIQTQEKGEKLHFGPDLSPFAQIRTAKIAFQKSVFFSVTRYHGQLSSCTILEKTNDPFLKKLCDGQTGGQTDKSDFIGHCPTNVERPKTKTKATKQYKNIY